MERKAKYTMLFADYLEEGGSLPSSFSLITGFEDIFKKHYCDKELGFETELLFYMKLEEKADLFMQEYADRLTRLAEAYGLFDAGAKVHYTQDYQTFVGGAQHAETTELPLNTSTAQPSVENDSASYTNTDTKAITLTETGGTLDELQRRVEFLNSKAHLLIIDLLNEFKPCFMQVY